MPEQKNPTTLLALVVHSVEKKATKSGTPYAQIRAFTLVRDEHVWWDVQCFGKKVDPALGVTKNQRIWVDGQDITSEWEGKTYRRVWADNLFTAVPLDAPDSDDLPF